MRLLRNFAWFTLAAGLTLPVSLMAQDWDGARDRYNDRQDIRHDARDLHHDYANLGALRADVARDRARMNEHIREGNDFAASRYAADLARDQRQLDALTRDIRHDQYDIRYDRRDLHRDYRY